jgi:hypothetical protein
MKAYHNIWHATPKSFVRLDGSAEGVTGGVALVPEESWNNNSLCWIALKSGERDSPIRVQNYVDESSQ